MNMDHEQPRGHPKIKGSHHHFKHPLRTGKVTVPHPLRDVKAGTLANIERQSGVPMK
jgi:predicted RNA binding protein YcfA (HicA-like mRNA interferase family)